MTISQQLLRAVLCTALVVCFACNPRARVELARRTADDFHDRYNREDYSGMYGHAGPAVRSSSTEAAFIEYEKGVRAKLGNLKSAEVSNYNLVYLLSGPQVRLDYKCKFAKGDGVESFEIGFENGKAVINGYRLDSPQLEVEKNSLRIRLSAASSYSMRRASVGFTVDARCAGMSAAPSAAEHRTKTAMAIAAGSVGFTS